MESDISKYDLPVDYIVGEGFAKDLLKSYKNFPCKLHITLIPQHFDLTLFISS